MRRHSTHAFAPVLCLGITSTLALTAACTPVPDEPELAQPGAPLRRGIVGGDIDKDDPAVVLLYAAIPGGGAWICTAEVISPHVVLTAAHCVTSDGGDPKFRVFLGWDLNDEAQRKDTANWIEVNEVHPHPKYKRGLSAGSDIAVVVTKTAVPVTPLPFMRWPMTDNMRYQRARVVGYGLSDPADFAGKTSGTKRQMILALTDFDYSFVYFSEAYKGTCFGDSGGPAFLRFNGVDVIIGVASYVSGNCLGGSTETRVDTFAAWIDQWIRMYDPTFTITDAGMPPPWDMIPAPVADMAAPAPLPEGGCTVAGSGHRSDAAATIGLGLALLVLARLARRR